ncbi:S-Ena type endospore appendage [Bacillus sp. SCS-151]|uniref:S-Ena type endospore appendage n=1 Tax=Nanhaiella sioensis TaxID=3115293 RepID=UPI00397C94F5
MSTYKATPCCGKSVTKETSACCDCPVITGTLRGTYDLDCGQTTTIFSTNTSSAINGTIEVDRSSLCGVNVIITANGMDTILNIPPSNNNNQANSHSLNFNMVTSIKIMCTGASGDSCLGDYEFIITERCITTIPVSNNITQNIR